MANLIKYKKEMVLNIVRNIKEKMTLTELQDEIKKKYNIVCSINYLKVVTKKFQDMCQIMVTSEQTDKNIFETVVYNPEFYFDMQFTKIKEKMENKLKENLDSETREHLERKIKAIEECQANSS